MFSLPRRVRSKPPRVTLFLGIDIGGTKSAVIIGDKNGTVLARMSALTPAASWPEAQAVLRTLTRAVCRDAGVKLTAIATAGVSHGGPVNSRTGIAQPPPNLPAWGSLPLKALLEAELGLRVMVENDANATALAEHRWGAGQGCQDMAFLTLGTGIGAGLILNNVLYRGRSDLAGEIGHTTITPDGPLCVCGKRGCLEALASGTALGRCGRELFSDKISTARDVCALARLGNPLALSIIADAAWALGIGLANLLHTLNLERIVLGTLAVHAGDLLLEPIRAATKAHCWPEIWEGVSIVPAALGDAAQDKAALAAALQ